MTKTRIVIIDDESSVRFSLVRALGSDDVVVDGYETARAGIEAIERDVPDLVLLDVRLPDMSGLDALLALRAIDPKLMVVVITAHGTTDTAIEATKRGAFDYLLKPFELTTLRAVVAKATEASRLARRPTLNAEPGSPPAAPTDWIVGRSAAMQEVFKAIGRVANSDVNVLLLGESGVGKELVARAIYQHSSRADKMFHAINCAAIPETLLESELFGHEKGAFTGAERQRIGRFEQATGGTVFLDEIGDMSPAIQAKVLRLLQDQRFERVGGGETIQTDVRIIAATNQNLTELVAAGRFRQDLFYRLNTYTIALPPLRGRRDDLPLLVDHFIKLHSGEINKHVEAAAPETLLALESYSWPGNVRELQGVVKTALVNATSDVLTPDCLPESILSGEAALASLPGGGGGRFDLTSFVHRLLQSREEDVYRKVMLAVDRIVLDEALHAANGNQVEASRSLGISRTTLRAKLQLLSQRPVETPAASS
ncbi:MAG: sigma-54-dependent Fis family transcriptional regulator [Pirellulales bacterium]|nr:sigma-54-dependent Fis family transcriptional regulator [Pirellulales bacterium]